MCTENHLSIRSAGAFGWDRLFVEDRASAWFGADRVTRSEGRGAARRGRNPIRVIPERTESRFAFREVSVITRSGAGVPLQRARLAGGPQQLIAFPDEGAIDCRNEDWSRLAQVVTFVHIDVPATSCVYHYRLMATIALAEVARQVGRREPGMVARPRRLAPFYDRTLAVLDQEQGETVFLDDLDAY